MAETVEAPTRTEDRRRGTVPAMTPLMTARDAVPTQRGTSPGRPVPSRPGVLDRALDRGRALDTAVTGVLRPVTLPALRVLLGVLFVWFGALKVLGLSPVADIVAGTLPFIDPDVVVPVLGGVEVLLGAALVAGVAVRLVLPALAAHLSGTFLTFVMLPDLMFRDHNPLLLTESGEFVTKNLVLVAATLVLVSHSRSRAER